LGFCPDRETVLGEVTRGGQPLAPIDCKRISVIEEKVMYWHKANHIHAWFVDNVQSGNDDCGTYVVSKDKLRELLSTCQQVLEASKLVDGTVYSGTEWSSGNSEPVERREPGRVIEDPTVAKQLLPTQSGFFFGNVEFDEDYLKDVKVTRDWAARMLSELEKTTTPCDFVYSSSW
jgi:hypothetical protein